MFAVLISDTQSTTKVTTQLSDFNGRNELEKTTEMYLTVISSAILHHYQFRKKGRNLGKISKI